VRGKRENNSEKNSKLCHFILFKFIWLLVQNLQYKKMYLLYSFVTGVRLSINTGRAMAVTCTFFSFQARRKQIATAQLTLK
jgi:hypothetical protein